MKGVKESIVKTEITFYDYKKCLDDTIKQYKSINLISSCKNELYTIEINKALLSEDDDKREILKDRINILSQGHYDLKYIRYR